MKKILLATAAVALSSSPAFAAGDTDTAQGSATATVIAPITITHDATTVLSFGTFTAGTGGLVTVTAAGAGSAGGDVVLTSDLVESADGFDVTGDASRSFDISVAGGTVTETGGATMGFATSASATTGTLSATGTDSFTVGGVLTVASGQTAGDYTGSYDATVTYN